VRDVIYGVCYQRYEKRLEQESGRSNFNVLRYRRKFGRGTISKSVFDYRFNLKKRTHMFLFVTQASWIFILRICFFCVESGFI